MILKACSPLWQHWIMSTSSVSFSLSRSRWAEVDENLYLAARNLPGVYTVDVSGLDPVSLVGADKVIVTVDAVNKIQEWLG